MRALFAFRGVQISTTRAFVRACLPTVSYRKAGSSPTKGAKLESFLRFVKSVNLYR